MEANTEEQLAYEEGFSDMWKSLKGGNIPPHDSIGKELRTLFALASKSERVSEYQRGADMEINQTVSIERNCAQLPACRFHGSMAALLAYSKACREQGFMPAEVKFD